MKLSFVSAVARTRSLRKKTSHRILPLMALLLMTIPASVPAQEKSPAATDSLPNFDKRLEQAKANQLAVVNAAKANAASVIRNRVKDVRIDTDEILGSPKFVASTRGYLIGANGRGTAVSAATTASANGALG
jgi:hypothetical protein